MLRLGSICRRTLKIYYVFEQVVNKIVDKWVTMTGITINGIHKLATLLFW